MPIDPVLKRDLQTKAAQVRKIVLQAVHKAGAGHIGGPLSMVEIAVAAQDKFGVEIPDDQLKDLKTVQDVVNFVAKDAGSTA